MTKLTNRESYIIQMQNMIDEFYVIEPDADKYWALLRGNLETFNDARLHQIAEDLRYLMVRAGHFYDRRKAA